MTPANDRNIGRQVCHVARDALKVDRREGRHEIHVNVRDREVILVDVEELEPKLGRRVLDRILNLNLENVVVVNLHTERVVVRHGLEELVHVRQVDAGDNLRVARVLFKILRRQEHIDQGDVGRIERDNLDTLRRKVNVDIVDNVFKDLEDGPQGARLDRL